MTNHNLGWQLLGVALTVLFLSGCSSTTPTPEPTPTSTPIPPTNTPAPTPTPELPDKILFVGSSLTYYNRGLDYHMEKLANAANPPLAIEAEAVARGGASLKTMWKYSEARELIGKGDYDVVVLQGALFVPTDVDTFHEYVRKFDAEIKETGAETVLFMLWPIRTSEFTIGEMAEAHREIAAELGVDVAPFGLACQRAMEERPELDLYTPDMIHPNIYGTYLAVNVVYATVFGKSPSGIAYLASYPVRMTEEEAAFLQRVAWETVQEYQAQ